MTFSKLSPPQNPTLISERCLTEDLWALILARVPEVKTLLQLRCVSKEWRSIIDSPSFARSHVLLSPSEGHLLVHWFEQPLSQPQVEMRCIPSLSSGVTLLHVPPSIYQHEHYHWYVQSCLYGLFMLKKFDSILYGSRHQKDSLDYMLWNPATKKTLILPPVPQTSTPPLKLYSLDLGLGFDPSENDFKYVRLVQNDAGPHSTEIYSLATKSWKLTPCNQGTQQLRIRITDHDGTGLCVNGFMFQIATNLVRTCQQLVSFDLKNKTLELIELPANDSPIYYPGLTMADDGSSLSVVFCYQGSGSVWVLEGLGDARSWSKRYTFSAMYGQVSGGCFFHLTKNGELLIRRGPNRLITSYNLHSKKEKVIARQLNVMRALVYIESLVSF